MAHTNTGGGSSESALPSLATHPKYIFFTDFDGTITKQDSNDYITDHLGFGAALRKAGNADVLYGRRHFRDAFQEMMDSIHVPFQQCIDTLRQNITLDPYFKEFVTWARSENVPIVVLSGGMRPIIEALLRHLLGKEADELRIVSNDVAVRGGKASIDEKDGWKIVFHDGSSFGHDKSLEIRPYANLPESQRPFLFYAGDGVSDLSAAKETDLLFAKAGRDLVTYCEKEGIPFTTFEDWSSILSTMKDIVAGKTSVKAAATGREEPVQATGDEQGLAAGRD